MNTVLENENEQTITPAQAEVTLEVTPEVPKEFVYEYQPLDDVGRPLGAKQVFKGATAQEVLDKVANAHKESIKLNRELKKNIRLGNIEQDDIPQNAARLDVSALEVAPVPLTAEERVQLSRDLLDPEKFEAASARLVEAQIGKPETIRTILSRAQEDISALRAQEEAKVFVKANPDYLVCPENFETITSWMIKNKLAPIRDNFQLAYNRLKAVGLLLEAPIVREETPVTPVVEPQVTPENTHPVTETTSRITSEEPSQTKRAPKVASGFTRTTISEVGTPSQSGKLTVADIEKMPSDVYKRKLVSDPAFRKAVDELLASR